MVKITCDFCKEGMDTSQLIAYRDGFSIGPDFKKPCKRIDRGDITLVIEFSMNLDTNMCTDCVPKEAMRILSEWKKED